MALRHSEDAPASVREVSSAVSDYIGRLGQVWVEGQLSEVKVRPGAPLVFMRLRDVQSDASLSLVATPALFGSLTPPPSEGARVVVQGKLEFWGKRGDLHLRARTIRAVGLGELLARLEQLRSLLAAEGLFDVARKQPLPFLPRRIGVICGRNSDAERDVVANASRRWPAVQFEIRGVAVQGAGASAAVIEALVELDGLDDVDVIIITRGGGSVEDLLPFSDETLLRAVAGARTPVVSAIGHERDRPLLDEVADVRASTPTDAARQVVPDLAAEIQRVSDARHRLDNALRQRLHAADAALAALRNSPALHHPEYVVERQVDLVTQARVQGRRLLAERLTRASDSVESLRHRLHALSPAATLERGYAIVHNAAGVIAMGPDDIAIGSTFEVRLAEGQILGLRVADDNATAGPSPTAKAPKRPAPSAPPEASDPTVDKEQQ